LAIDDLQIVERLRETLAAGDRDQVTDLIDELGKGGLARVLTELEEDERIKLWYTLEPEDAAGHFDELPDVQVVATLESLAPDHAARILDVVPSDSQADYISDIETDDRERILEAMLPEEAEDARRLLEYKDDVAGGLMRTEFLAYPEDMTIEGLLEALRNIGEDVRNYEIQYIYVTDRTGTLVGVLQLRDILLRSRTRMLNEVMIAGPSTVRDNDSLDKLEDLFDRVQYLAVPVVDDRHRLLGVLSRHDVEEALGERQEDEYLKSLGIVGGEELRSMPVFLRARRRLSWLSVNIILNIVAASVIAARQDTLEAVIALAVFLPIISDMSGCTGNQAVAVSMRELALGIARPNDAFRVWRQEFAVGLINGVALGGLLGFAAWLWKGNPWLGAVIAVAMVANTIVAVSIGGVVPLVLKRMHFDPALASGPILTTITDVCGFLLVLSLAAAMIERLV